VFSVEERVTVVTLAQGVGIAAVLFIVTVLLGLVTLVTFRREDRRQERLRRDAMRGHPSQRDPWNEQDGPL